MTALRDATWTTQAREGRGKRALPAVLFAWAFLAVVGTMSEFVEATDAARTLHEALGVTYHIDPLKVAYHIALCALIVVPCVWGGVVLWRTSSDGDPTRSGRLAVWAAFVSNLVLVATDIPGLIDRSQDPSGVWVSLIDMALTVALSLWVWETLRKPPFRILNPTRA